MMDRAVQDFKNLNSLFAKVSKNLHLVIISRGPSAGLVKNYGDIPDLTLGSDLGLKMVRNKEVIKSAGNKILEEARVIKNILAQVVEGKFR